MTQFKRYLNLEKPQTSAFLLWLLNHSLFNWQQTYVMIVVWP